MSKKKFYYIMGSKENPEGVKQALLEVYPNAENPNCLVFTNELGVYYVLDNIMYYSEMCNTSKIIKSLGEELQPKTQEKVEFVEEVMYHSVFFTGFKDEVYEGYRLYETIEEATNRQDAVGYREVKIMMKKD